MFKNYCFFTIVLIVYWTVCTENIERPNVHVSSMNMKISFLILRSNVVLEIILLTFY